MLTKTEKRVAALKGAACGILLGVAHYLSMTGGAL